VLSESRKNISFFSKSLLMVQLIQTDVKIKKFRIEKVSCEMLIVYKEEVIDVCINKINLELRIKIKDFW
jgi:hypothetical protein